MPWPWWHPKMQVSSFDVIVLQQVSGKAQYGHAQTSPVEVQLIGESYSHATKLSDHRCVQFNHASEETLPCMVAIYQLQATFESLRLN